MSAASHAHAIAVGSGSAMVQPACVTVPQVHNAVDMYSDRSNALFTSCHCTCTCKHSCTGQDALLYSPTPRLPGHCAGVGGQDCSTPDLRPCTNRYRTDRSSSTPASHIGPNKRDIDWAATGWTPSRCAGVCDDATAICYCDGPHHGRVPAPEGSPPGTPAVQSGRLLHGNCQRLRSDDKGQPLRWGAPHAGMTYEDIYGAQVCGVGFSTPLQCAPEIPYLPVQHNAFCLFWILQFITLRHNMRHCPLRSAGLVHG
jgi:hypothetical protein